MRSLILVVATVFFLALGFMVYYWVQPQHKQQAGIRLATTGPTTLLAENPGSGFGPAFDAGTQIYDPNTGDLARSFQTDSFTRLQDGRFAVTKPIAKFFTFKNHQLVRELWLEAKSGIVTQAHGSRSADPFKGHQMAAPSSGEMHGVIITIHEPDAKNVLQETLRITMANAWFDNETFKIYTQGFTDPETGQTYAADWVRVVGKGDDTHPDFVGYGLTLKWNERDRKLDLLDIAHGESLTLKHAKKFGPGQATAQARTETNNFGTINFGQSARVDPRLRLGEGVFSNRPAESLSTDPLAFGDAFDRAMTVHPLPTMLVDGDAAAPAEALPDEPPQPRRRHRVPRPETTEPSTKESRIPRHPHELPDHQIITPNNVSSLYRATFLDDVRIEQSGQQLVTADRMFVDFLMEQEHPATQPTSGPATETAATSERGGTSAFATPPAAAAPAAPTRAGSSPEALAGARPTAASSEGPTPRARHTAGGAAATQPAEPDEPITVYWTGRLIIQPLTESAEQIPPGDEIITLESVDHPVIAKQNNSEIRCASLTYRTQDGTMTAEDAERLPVTLTTNDGKSAPTIIRTTELTYSRPRQVAVLRGKGSTDMPSQADGTPLKANWAKSCTIYFTPDEDGRTAIDHAEMEGDVHVVHPQFKLRSDLLDLSFDTTRAPTTAPSSPTPHASPRSGTLPMALPAPGPTSLPTTRGSSAPASPPMNQSNLRQMVATGSVHCDMTDSSKKTQTIDCNRLTVLTMPGPDGKSAPRTINADGDVHTVDPDQDMHAGHLAVQLRPSTRPSTRPAIAATKPEAAPGQAVAKANVAAPTTSPSSGQSNMEVESLVAHDNVVVVTKDGTTATADQMLVNMVDGKARVKFLGSPTAKIVDKQSTVIGAIISLNPDGQEMTVDGEGEMHSVQQETPTTTPRPMDVFWTRSLLVNGKDNIADAIGGVRAVVKNADGSEDKAKGDHMRLLLADVAAPATRPTTREATAPAPKPVQVAAAPGTQPATQPTASMNLMGKKTIRQAIFYDNAEVSSTLLDANGGLLRRMDVFASEIQYDVIQKDGVPQKKVTIPCPGRMLVEDYRPPAPKTAPQPGQAPAANANGGGDARGATAFQWSKKLTYDDATRQVVMEGSQQDPVIIDHREDSEKGEPMRLNGDTVTADLEPIEPAPKLAAVKAPAAAQPGAPAVPPANNEPHFQVKLMTAHGHLILVSRNSQLTADTMIYNPITHWVHAIGTERQPAVYSKLVADQRGFQPITGDEMEYNTVSEEVNVTKALARMHR